jgi:hypothetical protein
VVGIPVRQVLLRTGFSQWWTLLVLIPLVNLVALWIFAFSNWPRQSSQPGNVLPNQS